MNSFLLLLPDLALITLGFVLSRKADWGQDLWPGLEKLVYYVMFPTLIFHSIVRNAIEWDVARPVFFAVVVIVLSTAALGALARPLLKPSTLRHASALQCAFRFNSYLLLSISQTLGGFKGVAIGAIVLASAVPLCNLLAVAALAHRSSRGLFKELLTNPLIIATLAGIAFNLLQWKLPAVVDTFAQRTGSAALALGLMTVGAGVRLGAMRGDLPLIAWLTAVKLIAAPLIALGVSRLFDLPPDAARILLVFGALPTATASYVLATRMGGDGPYVAVCVTASMLAAVVTLPLWLTLVT